MMGGVCEICLEDIKYKCSLKCGCVFCLGCIYRYLFDHDKCPKCRAEFNTIYNLKVHCERINKSILPNKIGKLTERNLKTVLKLYNINVKCGFKELKELYKELLVITNIESYKEESVDITRKDIAIKVHKSFYNNKKKISINEIIKAAQQLHIKVFFKIKNSLLF
ncbi:hypothetical protein A0H76_848 [Hepatospora eriocheir]|uniref:RING-type domain-containing protein n=1 Tax=Hepatospora eriocheir TaxID=1081669 RepID=A0A1X0QIB5_9MICR|nr:hypothetical protein A0H76_848 [Hepatospora eriocheir]